VKNKAYIKEKFVVVRHCDNKEEDRQVSHQEQEFRQNLEFSILSNLYESEGESSIGFQDQFRRDVTLNLQKKKGIDKT